MEPLFARDARADGGAHALERSGDLDRIRPGVYVPKEWAIAPHREQHILKVRAAARVLSSRTTFSHESAAALHGIPVVDPWPSHVRASFDSPHGRFARAGLRWSRTRLQRGDVVEVAGIRATSPMRTAIDLARSGTLAQGVVALDHVFASGVRRESVDAWTAAAPKVHGLRRLHRALSIARGRSESPLESLSMARFHELGFSLPGQQVHIAGFRVDFFWPEVGVVGEADGRSKYARPDDLWQEKRREDTLRQHTSGFIRWSWGDAAASAPLASILTWAGIPRL